MSRQLKIQMAISFAVTLLVGIAIGVLGSSYIIGDWVAREMVK